MNNKLMQIIGCSIVAVVLCVSLMWSTCFHKLENQDLAIVQSFGGELEVRKNPGWWCQIFPTITRYPKAGIYICSSESTEHDPFIISFNNKSTATMNAQLGYRIDGSSDEKIIALHQAAEGNDDKIWQLIVGTVNTEAQKVSTTFDPSEVMGGDKFPEFVQSLQSVIIHNNELLESGIDIDKFNVIGKPIPDSDTQAQFDLQREADLAKRLAAAKVKQLAAETEKERAEADRKTEHEKIEAMAQMAKEKLDAERQKQNETIAAEKKLTLAKIAKDEAEIKAKQDAEVAKIKVEQEKAVAEVEANKLLKIAEISKATEAAKLETEKLIAEQQKVSAEAKKVQIELSGAITEVQKAQMDLELGIAKAKWENIGKGISGLKLPQVMNVGAGSAGGTVTTPLDTLIQTMTIDKIRSLEKPVK